MEMVKFNIQSHPSLSIVQVSACSFVIVFLFLWSLISFSGCNYSTKTSMQVMFVGGILFCSLRKFMQSTQTTNSSTTILVLYILDYTSNSCSLLLNRFDKVTRHGGLIGKRTVAGRVVKESYGASKQQHTFTVRLLFCSSIHFLQSPYMFPTLVTLIC